MMNKRIASLLLALTLILGALPVLAAEPENAGPPAFELKAAIVPESLTVYQNQPLTFIAAAAYTTNKNENQLLQFVSEKWTGADQTDPAKEIPLTLEAAPSARVNERMDSFVSTARLMLNAQPGTYHLVISYELTLRHDNSGKRSYTASATTGPITVTVLAGEAPAEEAQPQQTALGHGQVVSAWAQWKQTKGNKNFLPGGPDVPRSLNWYKAQVEYRTFYSREEVWKYLDSIYQPASRKDGKGPENGKGPGSKKPGK